VAPSVGWFVLLDGGLVLLAVLSASPGAYRALGRRVPLPSRAGLRRLLVGALALHLAEGAVAARLAQRRGLDAGAWALQTAIVGFPSLRILRSLGPQALDPPGRTS
jgi:hypothetical protein